MSLKVSTYDKGVMVFATEREGQNGKFTTYTLGISNKDKDGKYHNSYLTCRFKKGVVVENQTKIKITNSFFSTLTSQGKNYPYVMIIDFENLDSGTNSEDGFIDMSNIKDDELPFAD